MEKRTDELTTDAFRRAHYEHTKWHFDQCQKHHEAVARKLPVIPPRPPDASRVHVSHDSFFDLLQSFPVNDRHFDGKNWHIYGGFRVVEEDIDGRKWWIE